MPSGLIYDYETIKDKIGKELADKFDSIKINIGDSNKVEAKLFNFNESGNLKNDLESINNILLELSSIPKMYTIELKDTGKGLQKHFDLKMNPRPSDMSKYYKMPNYRVRPIYRDTSILSAGTIKNKKAKKNKKTINKRIQNTKKTIKKRENKIKRNTKRR